MAGREGGGLESLSQSLEVRVGGQKAGWTRGHGSYATQAPLVAFNLMFQGS